jgi:lipopolysaccharide transport system permease protein
MVSAYQIIKYRSIAELNATARRGYLGFLWWIIEPILYMSVFYVLFAVGLRKGGIEAVPFFLSGLITWKWFASSIGKAGTVLESNANVFKQVRIPVYIFPLVMVIVNTFKFCIVFSLLLVFLAFYSDNISNWWGLPVVLFIQFLLIVSLTFWVSAVVPIIPDLQQVIQNCLLLLFFLSGVFFDISIVNDNIARFLMLNPMTLIIDSYRHVLVYGNSPDFPKLFALAAFCFVMLLGGIWFLNKFSYEYPKIIR